MLNVQWIRYWRILFYWEASFVKLKKLPLSFEGREARNRTTEAGCSSCISCETGGLTQTIIDSLPTVRTSCRGAIFRHDLSLCRENPSCLTKWICRNTQTSSPTHWWVVKHSIIAQVVNIVTLVTIEGVRIGWLYLLTPYAMNSYLQATEHYRWFAQFAVYRYTPNKILSLR
jgi:hypothetical protein